MALSSNQQEQLSTFVAMTSAESEIAKSFLKAASWNMETAIDRYYAFGGDASKLAPPSNNNNNNNNNNNSSSSINQHQSQTGFMSATANMISSAMGIFGGGQIPQQQGSINGHNDISSTSSSATTTTTTSQMDQDALLAQQLAASSGTQQPFVRAPDRAYQDRMVGPYTNQFGSSVYKQRRDAQENFAKDWQKGPRNQKSTFLGALFSDPQYKFQGSLEDAKKKGSRENKWLLINIQDTENFCSHCLNRDIWKDKDLMPVIRETFIFYQWVTKTDNAKRVINLYHPTKFPCIFVCDPNTGRQEHEFIVPDSPDKINQLKPKILEFLDNYPNPKAKPKKIVPKNITSKQLAPRNPDDELLQQAIHASLQQQDVDDDIKQEKEKEKMEQSPSPSPPKIQTQKQQQHEQLQSQPDAKDPNATAIRIRMPNGSILQRIFLKNSKVSQLYIWCKLSLNGKNVSLLQTMPRLKLDDQKDKTLKELGLIRATLVCSLDD